MVNFDALNIPYRLGSQRTKMRLHGLIAKFRGGDGVHVQNTWLITKKGGDFLRGIPVQETVVVFDNQVIGHEGKMVSIESLIDEVVTIADPITTPEADVYHDVRTPKRDATHQAEYVGPDRVGIKRGERYEITVSRMVMGQPVKVTDPFEFNYRDIAAFQREWKIV